jgi:hypothetical protein
MISTLGTNHASQLQRLLGDPQSRILSRLEVSARITLNEETTRCPSWEVSAQITFVRSPVNSLDKSIPAPSKDGVGDLRIFWCST